MRLPASLSPGSRCVSLALSCVLMASVCFGVLFDSQLHGASKRSGGDCLAVPIVVGPPTFEAIAPSEFHVGSNRQVVRGEFVLRNTTRCRMTLGTLCCDKWQCGLVPAWTVEFPDASEGPIVPDSVKLDLKNLSGNRICAGMQSCPIAIEFRLKEGATVGVKQTFRLNFSLADPCTGAVQKTDWAVDLVIRKSGLPLLTGEKIPFPSEGK